MNPIDTVRITILFLGFSIASWQDLKTREIDDKIWIAMSTIGLLLLAVQIYFEMNSIILIMILLSFIFSAGMGILLYQLDLFGGADAKALIALSIIMPIIPGEIIQRVYTHPFTPIAVFNNSVIGAASTSIFMVIRNLKEKISGGKLFEGLEDENAVKKLLAMITGYRVSIEKLSKGGFNYPIEEIEISEGKVRRRLKIKVGASSGEENLKKILKLYEEGRIKGRIWATPALPMLIFMTIGLAVTFIWGDVIFKFIIMLRS